MSTIQPLYHIKLLNFIKEVIIVEEKHFYYAEISENNICTAVLDTPVEITDNQKMSKKNKFWNLFFK